MGSALLEKGDNGQKDEGFGLDGVLFNDGEGEKDANDRQYVTFVA